MFLICKVRIQGRMQIFERSALNRVLALAQERGDKMVQITQKHIDLGAPCVELRPIYCSKWSHRHAQFTQLSPSSQSEIYDIGTKILLLQ